MSLTITVEKLEPVVNPVIGLFAVGFLGCIRTQRHKRRRREVGVSQWTDFEATFPTRAPGRGAGQAGAQQRLRPTVIPLPHPRPDPYCSLFPFGKLRGARTGDPLPLGTRAWASRGRSRAWSRDRGRVHPRLP